MSDYLSQLNDVQRNAVTAIEGPVMVIAGPGSGKTRVLTYRIAHIIESGVPAYQILALTFTNKAAKEMKERIEKVVGEKAKSVWAGTFHSIFARILRSEAEKIGYPSDFTIYDTDDTKSLIGSIIKEMNLNKDSYNVNVVKNRISSAKSNLIPPKAYKENVTLMAEDKVSKRTHFSKIYTEYMKRCKRAGAMDFDDLLYQFYFLLYTNPDEVLEKYRARFKFVLVDEFQDTNFLQYAIVKKLVNYKDSKQNLCVVGDDAQSIYAFRGATIDNILDLEKDYPNLQTFKLEQNYRSTSHIVQAANQVITYNSKQLKKKIWSDKGAGQKIKLIKAMTDTEEAKRVGGLILEQKTRNHLRNSEIAILYRTNSQSRTFEESLRRFNVPYKVYGGQSFYQRKEIKDFLAYLRVVTNPRDEEGLKRIINYPRRGIGKSSFDQIAAFAVEADKSIYNCLAEVPLGTAARKNINKFRNMMALFVEKATELNAYETASYVAKQSGILSLLKSDTTIEGMNRLENLNALMDGIKDFVENDEVVDDATMPEKTLAAYLQSIALYTDLDSNDNDGDHVTLMTTHAAKGLEFPSVFVVGLEEDLFPSFMAKSDRNGIEEERRLFYVAITRAEEYLTLSFAKSRYQYGKMRYNDPSRFLDEIDQQHLDGEVSSSSNNNFSGNDDFTSAPGPAKVVGNFKTPVQKQFTLNIDPKTFKPSPGAQIQAGQKVLHLRFGEGKVISTDGRVDNRVAVINFAAAGSKRLMLKFAKLQIL
ncbi:MAG: DNA helicase-2/ATP-dependent DNA helicase PcrA [Maribacter sp.]|jgi:DNA helicase-2/ATP-dependent DNA helicase PcrA